MKQFYFSGSRDYTPLYTSTVDLHSIAHACAASPLHYEIAHQMSKLFSGRQSEKVSLRPKVPLHH